ncbi:MAG: GMC family oxidoreductase [Deltaproteobacteria bacterium]|nr:GMC family oxidoreductase [Deltaproteobacteria bacterium]
MPAGARFGAADPGVVDRLQSWLAGSPASTRHGYTALLHALGALARLRRGRPFESLPQLERTELLDGLLGGGYAARSFLRAVVTPLKVARYDDPRLFALIDATYRAAEVREEGVRGHPRLVNAAELAADEELEADVVVVGSGAGGAVVAAELAQLGQAVVVLEEGGHYARHQYTGRPVEMQRLLYREGGVTPALGSGFIPVLMGRCVGGTTAINSGTCYRTPERVLHKWSREYGLSELTAERLEPYFAKVERVLGVAPADARYLGGMADVIARGCDALGIAEHGPLLRNAPDCDGQGLCCFGCPTGAKRSTDVSYLPVALRSGASVYYNARVDEVLLEGSRAVGVVASTADGRALRVRAKAVVICAGAVMTPALLLRQGLANQSGELGRNLSIHPAAAVLGLFPTPVRGYAAIPQGYGIEAFHGEGLLFEGAFAPLDLGAGALTQVGRRYSQVMEAYDRLGCFGFLVEDTSRGRVWGSGPGGRPLMTYHLNDHDLARLRRGLEILFRIYLAAGAEAIFPPIPGAPEIRDLGDIARFRRMPLRARDLELTAYHPLGTARMGRDPRRSVVGPTHETHDVRGLFVCDGASVPSSIAVNPQITIMALASRAAEFVAERAHRG